jgi:hypothetical protein
MRTYIVHNGTVNAASSTDIGPMRELCEKTRDALAYSSLPFRAGFGGIL